MLTPLLTAKSVTPSAAPAPMHSVSAKEPVVPKNASQAGQLRSEAALRILETLNRHLVGTKTLPKEALLRLLDTLSRLLKVQPLPQESVRDFGRRIAVAIEALPPAARQALEKQLGQRNLALSVRILAEIVKALPTPDMTHQPVTQAMPQQARVSSILAQDVPIRREGQIQANLLPSTTPAQSPAGEFRAVPVVPSPQQLPIQAFMAAGLNAGTLQVVLRSAFMDEPARTDALAADQSEPEVNDNNPLEKKADRAASSAPVVRFAIAEGNDPIPALHTVAHFLTENPDTLEQVIAIIGNDIDEDLRETVQQVLDTDTSLETVLPVGDAEAAEHIAMPSEHDVPEVFADAASGEEDMVPPSAGNIAAAEPEYTIYDLMTQPEAPEEKPAGPSIPIEISEEADAELSDKKSEQSPPRSDPPFSERAARTIADALKTLIDAGMPLPSDGLNEPLEKLVASMMPPAPEDIANPTPVNGKPLPPGGQPIFAAAGDEATALLDMGEAADSVSTEAGRSPLRSAGREDLQREPLPSALPEATFLRETLPFLAMPIPAKPVASQKVDEEEASRRFDQDEEQDGSPQQQSPDDGASGEKSDRELSEADEETTEEAALYGLYHRP
jgi:hypothetical protein